MKFIGPLEPFSKRIERNRAFRAANPDWRVKMLQKYVPRETDAELYAERPSRSHLPPHHSTNQPGATATMPKAYKRSATPSLRGS